MPVIALMKESLISGSPLSVVIQFHIPELFSVFFMVYKSAVLHCGYVLTHLRSVCGIKDLCLYQFLLVLCIVINSSCKFCGISVYISPLSDV